jgi:hypothetical protein
MQVVKAETVDGYLNAVSLYLSSAFGISDFRVNPVSGARFPAYISTMRSFRRRDPCRATRFPFLLSHLRRALDAENGTVLSILACWAAIAVFLGLRSCEFLMSTYTARRPSPDGLPRGILATDITFITADGVAHAFDSAFDTSTVIAVRVRFRFQKNGNNNVTRDMKRSGDAVFCPVAIMLALRAHFLSLPTRGRDTPFAVDAGGAHISSESMSVFIKAVVLRAAPNTSAADLELYTTHSFRVGGLYQLLQTKVNIELAVDYLRWRSASYMLYVRSCMTNFSSLTATGEDIIADFNADANYDSDVDDNGDE